MTAPDGMRFDIQALRAVAVGLVVVYHFWPGSLTGGYVGVDVFFVISGFLITGHLLEHPPASLRDLGTFWGRRIRRLLPAAFLVLLTTLAATWLLAPPSMWAGTARQALASALYAQNWLLARDSVDYLAADNVATPVQHYWSLSIEEQFYLGWPVLVLLAAWVARRRGWSVRACVGAAVGLVLVPSLAWSIHLGGDGAAYFVTWTRLWELAAGGLVAVVARRGLRLPGAGRTALAWLGLGAVVAAAATYDEATAFPGWAALVPVLGTAVVILAAVERGPLSPLPAMALRPVQALGDISYSVYLWHWPVVVLLPFAVDGVPGTPTLLVALAGVVVLSALTKRFVEDPLRGRRPLGLPLRRSFVFAVAGVVLVGTGSVGLQRVADTETRPPAAGRLLDPCAGAGAVANDCDDLRGDGLITSTAFAAADDRGVRTPCMSSLTRLRDELSCRWGSDAPDALRVALVGNSHAAQWLPVVQRLARSRDWSLTSYLIYQCQTVDRPVAFPSDAETDNCERFNREVVADVRDEGYDLVLFANRTLQPLVGLEDDTAGNERETTAAYDRVLTTWTEQGSRVLVLRDNPRRKDDLTAPACVDLHPDDLGQCDVPLAEADVDDPLGDLAAASDDPRVGYFDLRPYLCPDDVCRGVLGGVITLSDLHHLSASFVTTLRPQLARAVDDLLGRPAS